jgi:hypothetical protein
MEARESFATPTSQSSLKLLKAAWLSFLGVSEPSLRHAQENEWADEQELGDGPSASADLLATRWVHS